MILDYGKNDMKFGGYRCHISFSRFAVLSAAFVRLSELPIEFLDVALLPFRPIFHATFLNNSG